MSIQKGFKFLDAFSFSLEDKVMLLVWQSLQVLRAVIILNPIKMMDNPSFRQRFSVSFFPYKSMLANITFLVSLWMLRSIHIYITLARCFAASPIISWLAFNVASSTSKSSEVTWFTAINTRVLPFLSPSTIIKGVFGWNLYHFHNTQYTILSSYLQLEVLR